MKKLKNIVVLVLLIFAFFAFADYFQTDASLSVEETKQNSKTIKFFIFQGQSFLQSNNSTTTQFNVFIGEKNPIIKDAYIEIRGIALSGSVRNITADINNSDSFPTSRQQSFAIGDSGRLNFFRLFYNGSVTASTTSYFADVIQNPGSYNFYFKLNSSNVDISMLQARLVLTYQFTPPSAGISAYPAYGEIISPIFDTGAANGVTYNKIILKGSTPIGTKIRFQISTSNDSGGPWTYYGSNCDTSSYYWDGAMSASEESKEIKCFNQHNNKRYFRYKGILCSADCSNGGSATPQIDDIMINWSP